MTNENAEMRNDETIETHPTSSTTYSLLPTPSLKAELRMQISDEISALPDSYIFASDEGVFRRFLSLDEFDGARNIMMFHSVKKEPSTIEIAKTALSMGKTVAFPLCYRGGIMEARIVTNLAELRPAMLGIPAPPDTAPAISPEELDLIIVPALAFDKRGYRLGYGGGYYDRYLSGIPAFTVGITRERLVKDELPTQAHDIAVDCIVTEERVFCPILPKI